MLYMAFKVLSQNNKERSNIQIQLVLKLHINVIKRFSDTAEVLAHFLEITGILNLNECTFPLLNYVREKSEVMPKITN